MLINNNIIALNAWSNYQTHWRLYTESLFRLSSGLSINRAADNPSGLAISEKLRAQVRGLNQASRNAQDGIAMLNVAEGALNETHAILQRMRELSVQSANDTLTTSDRLVIQDEVNSLIEEIDRIASQTQFNTKELISGTPFLGKLHIGASSGATIDIELNSMQSVALDVDTLEVLSNIESEAAIDLIDRAIKSVSRERGRIGAYTNRLEHISSVNDIVAENTLAAESRIRDVDMAREMMEMSRHYILAQVAQAILAQANQIPLLMLQLLQQR